MKEKINCEVCGTPTTNKRFCSKACQYAKPEEVVVEAPKPKRFIRRIIQRNAFPALKLKK